MERNAGVGVSQPATAGRRESGDAAAAEPSARAAVEGSSVGGVGSGETKAVHSPSGLKKAVRAVSSVDLAAVVAQYLPTPEYQMAALLGALVGFGMLRQVGWWAVLLAMLAVLGGLGAALGRG